MQNFGNILFVSAGSGTESAALKQAVSLARNNRAALKALVVGPEFPKHLAGHKERFESSLAEQLKNTIGDVSATLQADGTQVDVSVECGNAPALRIIQHVLREGHDLVIKESLPQEGGKGFRAIDMELLRKCPCPVWLSRPIERHRNEIRVAVAIDPESEGPAAHDLSLRLLRLARSLAETCNGELNVVSCWDYEFESYLRHNAWFKLPEEEVEVTLAEVQAKHRKALDSLLAESGIDGPIHVHHIKGKPDDAIPEYVQDNGIDILVMGTLARTGIPSFLIGNTAEDIVQKLGCSLLALKPGGFVSPVKAY